MKGAKNSAAAGWLGILLFLTITSSSAEESFPKSQTPDLRTSYGAVFNGNCKDIIEATYRENLIKPHFDVNNANKGIQKVLKALSSCRKAYPEIKPYIDQAAQAMKTARITCQRGMIENVGAWGMAIGMVKRDQSILLDSILVDLLLRRGGGDQDFFAETLMHEVFHLTEANNHDVAKHADFHGDRRSDGSRCGPTATNDRVVAITAVCSSFLDSDPGYRQRAILSDQMACKPNRCIETFSKDAPSTVLFEAVGKHRPLSEPAAKQFCGRVKHTTDCLLDQADLAIKELGKDPLFSKVRAITELSDDDLKSKVSLEEGFSPELFAKDYEIATTKPWFKKTFFVRERGDGKKFVGLLRPNGERLSMVPTTDRDPTARWMIEWLPHAEFSDEEKEEFFEFAEKVERQTRLWGQVAELRLRQEVKLEKKDGTSLRHLEAQERVLQISSTYYEGIKGLLNDDQKKWNVWLEGIRTRYRQGITSKNCNPTAHANPRIEVAEDPVPPFGSESKTRDGS